LSVLQIIKVSGTGIQRVSRDLVTIYETPAQFSVNLLIKPIWAAFISLHSMKSGKGRYTTLPQEITFPISANIHHAQNCFKSLNLEFELTLKINLSLHNDILIVRCLEALSIRYLSLMFDSKELEAFGQVINFVKTQNRHSLFQSPGANRKLS